MRDKVNVLYYPEATAEELTLRHTEGYWPRSTLALSTSLNLKITSYR